MALRHGKQTTLLTVLRDRSLSVPKSLLYSMRSGSARLSTRRIRPVDWARARSHPKTADEES